MVLATLIYYDFRDSEHETIYYVMPSTCFLIAPLLLTCTTKIALIISNVSWSFSLFVRLSLLQHLYLYCVCLSVCLFVCRSVCLFVCLSSLFSSVLVLFIFLFFFLSFSGFLLRRISVLFHPYYQKPHSSHTYTKEHDHWRFLYNNGEFGLLRPKEKGITRAGTHDCRSPTGTKKKKDMHTNTQTPAPVFATTTKCCPRGPTERKPERNRDKVTIRGGFAHARAFCRRRRFSPSSPSRGRTQNNAERELLTPRTNEVNQRWCQSKIWCQSPKYGPRSKRRGWRMGGGGNETKG